jgi:hypothetical protein
VSVRHVRDALGWAFGEAERRPRRGSREVVAAG